MQKALEYLLKNLDTLMVGFTTTMKGSVKANKESEPKTFTLEIDWSKAMFSYILNLAGQAIRIQEQAKMREEFDDLKDPFTWKVEIAKKEKRSATQKQAMATFDRLSTEGQEKFIANLIALQKK